MTRLNIIGFAVPLFFLGAVAHAQEKAAAPDPASVSMPRVAFQAKPEDTRTFDKYFFFHREGTSFAEAYVDIKECDALASGISYRAGVPSYYYGQYGIGGAIGGAIGSALADAIHGSAQRRNIRRVNMRNCMGFKGYDRYGLSKPLWDVFNFEEGLGRKADAVRERALQQQARVASGPKPQQRPLGI